MKLAIFCILMIVAGRLLGIYLGKRSVKRARDAAKQEVVAAVEKLIIIIDQAEQDKKKGVVRYISDERLVEIKEESILHLEYAKKASFEDPEDITALFQKVNPLAQEVMRAF